MRRGRRNATRVSYIYVYVQCTYVHERIMRSKERYLHVGFVVSKKYLHEGDIVAAKRTA